MQATYHNRSLSLYTSLGFQAREPLSVLQGKPLILRFPGYDVRPATATDAAACNALCQDVIGAASEFGGPGFLLPTRNHEVFAWCLTNGLRVMYPMTLMTRGLYNEPAGAWMPTVLY